ncbi:hypothetical protein VST7929_02200 [Vibrio stylophorae]|uniref:Uncharacterized protein n=1 Tax=Vibrio stylophorae TaxID=659351 RepID=A0ABM8ZVC5_9VIBR|nr:hypothetical protein [Vibrio stylophorae]CAH0534284.1 hypothetical protein VST7929_02200 [Vibrio stylophorae]
MKIDMNYKLNLGKKWANVFYSLSSASMPGLYRLFVLFLIARFSNDVLFINGFVFCLGLSMFSCLGVAIDFLRKISVKKENQMIGKHYIEAMLSMVAISLISCAIAMLFSGGRSFGLCNMVVLLTSFGIMHLERHLLLAKSDMKGVFKFDLIMIPAFFILFFFGFDSVLAVSLSIFISVCISRCHESYITWGGCNISASGVWSSFIAGLKLGYSNVVSGGVIYLIPMFLSERQNADDLNVISLCIAVSGVVLVLPRAVFNFNLGKIASVSFDENYFAVLCKTKKMINSACLFLLPISILFSFVYLAVSGINPFVLDANLYVAMVVLMLVLIVGQLSLVDSNLIIFLHRELIAIFANSVIFVVLFLLSVASYFKFGEAEWFISAFLLIMLLLYVARYYLYKLVVGKEVENAMVKV